MLDARRAKMDEQRNLRFIPGYVARISIGSREPESRVERPPPPFFPPPFSRRQ
jgi:hypothetical protein